MNTEPLPAFAPARVVSVDLASGEVFDPDLAAVDAQSYKRVLALCMLNGDPIINAMLRLSDGSDEQEIVRLARVAAWEQARDRLLNVFENAEQTPPENAQDLAKFKTVEQPPTGEPLPFVTVTVATLNNTSSALTTVRRILDSDYSNFEVLIVNNADSHSELQAAVDVDFGDDSRVRLSHEPRRGLSHARNHGWRNAFGEIVVFTDDDVIVSKHWLSRLVDAFSAVPHVGCVTGAIIPLELASPSQDLLEQYGGYNKGFEREVFDNNEWRRDDVLYPYNAGQFGSGANMAMRKSAIEKIGGFSPLLGAGTKTHGGEDLDVMQRVIFSDFAIVYEPGALLWHRHRRSYIALRKQMFRYGVGLGATITKWIVESRKHNFDVIRRLPKGIAYLLSPESKKNNFKMHDYPRVLSRLEVLGVIMGPIALFKSWRSARETPQLIISSEKQA